MKPYEEAAYLYFRIAEWFSQNPAGTPVPNWCELSLPIRIENVKELISLYEADQKQSVDGRPTPTIN